MSASVQPFAMAPEALPTVSRSPRVAWVDIARVITMMATMLTHAPTVMSIKQGMWFTGSGRMCLLFVVAGYFMARSCPPGVWFPQLKRAWRMVAAYVLLIGLYIICLGWTRFWMWQVLDPLVDGDCEERLDVLMHVFGIGDQPPGPFWFLRDLILLTLACGFLASLGRRKCLYPLIIACLCFGQGLACNHFMIDGYQVIHPREIAFFALGISLTTVPLTTIAAFLRRQGWWIVALFAWVLWYEARTLPHMSHLGIVSYIGATCVVALWIEQLLPRFSRWMASLGQTVFLVYVLHMLVISLLVYLLPFDVQDASFPKWCWFFAVPAIYLLIHYMGMGIKRVSPDLFDLLAIRPPRTSSK